MTSVWLVLVSSDQRTYLFWSASKYKRRISSTSKKTFLKFNTKDSSWLILSSFDDMPWRIIIDESGCLYNISFTERSKVKCINHNEFLHSKAIAPPDRIVGHVVIKRVVYDLVDNNGFLAGEGRLQANRSVDRVRTLLLIMVWRSVGLGSQRETRRLGWFDTERSRVPVILECQVVLEAHDIH